MKKIIIVALFLAMPASITFCIGFSSGRKAGWQKGYHKAWADYEMGFEHGRRSKHDYKPEYQTSEFQWKGRQFEEMLCKLNGIDYDGEWILSCPKCVGGARVQRTKSSTVYYGFFTTYEEMDKLKPSEAIKNGEDMLGQTYCSNCLYPEGTDWAIKSLGENP